MGKLKEKILTQENLEQLIELTNRAIEKMQVSDNAQILVLKREIEKQQRKLDNLYNVLESGKLDIDDIAPRIRELRVSIKQLRDQELSLSQRLLSPIPTIAGSQMKEYVENLRDILSEGTIFEQKAFVRSFIKKITVYNDRVLLEYTYPLIDGGDSSYSEEVLRSALKSSPSWTSFATIY